MICVCICRSVRAGQFIGNFWTPACGRVGGGTLKVPDMPVGGKNLGLNSKTSQGTFREKGWSL